MFLFKLNLVPTKAIVLSLKQLNSEVTKRVKLKLCSQDTNPP